MYYTLKLQFLLSISFLSSHCLRALRKEGELHLYSRFDMYCCEKMWIYDSKLFIEHGSNKTVLYRNILGNERSQRTSDDEQNRSNVLEIYQLFENRS